MITAIKNKLKKTLLNVKKLRINSGIGLSTMVMTIYLLFSKIIYTKPLFGNFMTYLIKRKKSKFVVQTYTKKQNKTKENEILIKLRCYNAIYIMVLYQVASDIHFINFFTQFGGSNKINLTNKTPVANSMACCSDFNSILRNVFTEGYIS